MAETISPLKAPVKPDDYVGQQRAVDSRLSILKHGARIFAEKGYDACTTREIATAAGVSHTNIRYHFGDKEALWLKVIQYLIAEAYQGRKFLEEIQSGSSPTQNFRKHTRNAISYYAHHPELPRIILFETLSNSDRLGKVRSAISEVFEQRIQAIEVMQDAGLIKNINARLLNEFIDGALAYQFVVSKKVDRDDTEAFENHIEQCFEMILQLVQN